MSSTVVQQLPPAVSDSADDAWRALHRAACAPYRRAGRFAWHWARGKLGRDPAFRGLLQRGLLLHNARVLDIGCGPALLASLLQACGDLQRRGGWPADWPGQPSASAYTGIELLPRDVARAHAALASSPLAPQVLQSDMRDAALPACELAVMLDVVHYIDPAAQDALLRRVSDALRSATPGRLLLRVADDSQRQRFWLTQWIDRWVFIMRGHRGVRTWGRPLAEWTALLQRLGFSVTALPMSQGTLFANVLLVCDLRP